VPLPRVLHPRYWGFHLLAVALLAAAVALGLWQYHAWSIRREAEARGLTHVQPIPLADAMGPDDAFPGDRVGQPVTVSGTWVPSGTIYVSGRERDGFWAVTPLATADGSAIEVVRGWAATRDTMPEPPSGSATVTGSLQPPEGNGSVDADSTDDVLPQLRIADAIQYVDQDLFSAYVVMTPPGPDLVQADLAALPDAGAFTALRNLLYAIEWWFFGGFVVFVWWRWLRDDVLADAGGQPVTG
jgi:surfeit locus 1 family protein